MQLRSPTLPSSGLFVRWRPTLFSRPLAHAASWNALQQRLPKTGFLDNVVSQSSLIDERECRSRPVTDCFSIVSRDHSRNVTASLLSHNRRLPYECQQPQTTSSAIRHATRERRRRDRKRECEHGTRRRMRKSLVEEERRVIALSWQYPVIRGSLQHWLSLRSHRSRASFERRRGRAGAALRADCKLR
jgi:hypothetical protein